MMKQTQFHDLRTDLVDALYQAGGCRTDFCTSQICCVPIVKLMDKVGLAYNPRPGNYWSNYVHAISTLVSFEEEMALEVIGMLVRSGNICKRNIWEGFSEIPMNIGELLSENDGHWRQRMRDLEQEQMSNAERVLIAKEFLYELTELALSDRYFESLQRKDS